jgi:hypothetical protein
MKIKVNDLGYYIQRLYAQDPLAAFAQAAFPCNTCKRATVPIVESVECQECWFEFSNYEPSLEEVN